MLDSCQSGGFAREFGKDIPAAAKLRGHLLVALRAVDHECFDIALSEALWGMADSDKDRWWS